MARIIPKDSTIYRIQYSAMSHEFVECKSENDLFEYIAGQDNQVVTGVCEICLNGTTPRVAVKTNPVYQKMLKAKSRLPVIDVKEDYWRSNNGCHYYLTPINKEDKDMIGDFSYRATKLSIAKAAGKQWASELSDRCKIKIIKKEK